MEECRGIDIANQKGGTSKTTTTENLGEGLAQVRKTCAVMLFVMVLISAVSFYRVDACVTEAPPYGLPDNRHNLFEKGNKIETTC